MKKQPSVWACLGLLLVAKLSIVAAQIPGDDKFDLTFCKTPGVVCPFPLVCANEETKEELAFFGCTFACTGTMSTEDEIVIFEELTLALSGIGLLISSFLTLTWGIFKEKSRQKMTFWLSFSSTMLTASIFWPTVFKAGKPRDVWCKNENDGYKQEDGVSLCTIQGFFIIFFGLAFCAWWFCSCVDIFTKLYLRRLHIEHWLKYYHIWAWSTSTTSAFLLLFLQHYGYESPRLWCFLDSDVDDYVEYIFFYIPVGIQWFVGTCMMILVILRVIKRAAKSQKNKGLFNKIRLYQTPISFVIIFNFFWAVFVSFRLVTLFGEDDYEESAESWVTCLLSGLQVNITPPILEPAVDPRANDLADLLLIGDRVEGEVGCGTVQPGRINPGLFGLTVFVLSGNAILLFFIFGTNRENYTLWARAIRNTCCCCPNKNEEGEQGSSAQIGSKIRNIEQEPRGPKSRPVVRFNDANHAETWNYGHGRGERGNARRHHPRRHPGGAPKPGNTKPHPGTVMHYPTPGSTPQYSGGAQQYPGGTQHYPVNTPYNPGPLPQTPSSRTQQPNPASPSRQQSTNSTTTMYFDPNDENTWESQHSHYDSNYYTSEYSDDYVDALWGIYDF